MSDTKTIAVYDAQVGDYVKLADKSPPQNLLDFIAALPAGGRVLDLGCGPGFSAATMAKHGLEVDAWDLSPAMVDHAAALPGVTAHVKSFDDLPGAPIFDGIFASFSLLHAPRAKVPAYIATIAASLKSNGVFHLGMKLGTGEARDAIGRHYCYFSQNELTEMLTQNGLRPVWHKLGVTEGLAGTIDPFIIIRSIKDA